MQRFRLHTGAAIYVDFKSIPYLDTEVIEWRDRLRLAETMQRDLASGRVTQTVAALRKMRVTHVVVPAGLELQAPGLERVYEDHAYQVYRLT
jgi:hypothetical protein